ncbi:hypothetical protein D3875_11200 [Deinococcus cavernae]|uniref:Transposase DDE domain-containing protein n=1 Tax=Deinococcus cavernae TaxID=2320857 RepID=A0A418V7J1_9DEIO|nr:transposase [Deinococcus cavernae]RJF72039.1 hypothetical protein D3875_11200 [Deinococcus cavernae]
MRTSQLLQKVSVADLFLHVFVAIDDYLQGLTASGRCRLPDAPDRKGSISELMTIATVGDILEQPNDEVWFELVKQDHADLFASLPDRTRYHRILLACERLFADFGLSLATTEHEEYAVIDSIPIPICRGARYDRPREQVEASGGRGSLGWIMGYKLHAVVSAGGMFKRFAVVGANVADPTVAKVLLNPRIDDLSAVLGDCAYLVCGVTAPSRSNAKKPTTWTTAMRKTRKMVETVFSRMVRCGLLVFGQLNSFRSVRTKFCRKVAIHNLLLYLTH